ncbi:MAG: HupE/UreJ family protein [Deltaproteobacteria bacterium]|nr:HupE/UreJ family protein [Deltaproteobacteria bacterium]
MIRFALLVVLVLVSAVRPAIAHPLDVGYIRVDGKDNTFAIALDIDIQAAALVLRMDEAKLDAATLTARTKELAELTYARSPIMTSAGPCTWSGAAASITGRMVRITDTATCTGDGPRRWEFPMIRESRISPTFELLVKEGLGDSERLTLVDRYQQELELGAEAEGSYGFVEFVWSGVVHIGAAPSEWHDEEGWKLPDGIDHILFLLALILGGGTLLQLIGIASGFTVGHSITLALAAVGAVRPPAEVIEPLIALSIAFVALEAITGLWKKHRWKIATAFGLVHGFGFANALSGLDLSTGQMAKALFGYNLGVELGQLALMVVLVPLVMLAHRNKKVGPYIIKGLAGLIFVAGMYWFIERVLSALS